MKVGLRFLNTAAAVPSSSEILNTASWELGKRTHLFLVFQGYKKAAGATAIPHCSRGLCLLCAVSNVKANERPLNIN